MGSLKILKTFLWPRWKGPKDRSSKEICATECMNGKFLYLVRDGNSLLVSRDNVKMLRAHCAQSVMDDFEAVNERDKKVL